MSLWSDEHAQLHVPRHKINLQYDIKRDYENLQHWSMEVPDQLIPNNCTIISTLTFHIEIKLKKQNIKIVSKLALRELLELFPKQEKSQ